MIVLNNRLVFITFFTTAFFISNVNSARVKRVVSEIREVREDELLSIPIDYDIVEEIVNIDDNDTYTAIAGESNSGPRSTEIQIVQKSHPKVTKVSKFWPCCCCKRFKITQILVIVI